MVDWTGAYLCARFFIGVLMADLQVAMSGSGTSHFVVLGTFERLFCMSISQVMD
jgi:hypothetical protein